MAKRNYFENIRILDCHSQALLVSFLKVEKYLLKKAPKDKFMKKTLWNAMFVALAVSVVAAFAQEVVLSANTIGYIKKSLPAGGKLITVSVPLFNMTAANNVFSNLSIASEAPVNSSVSFWNPAGQGWNVGSKTGKGWDANVKTQIVAPGEFFFIRGPVTSTLPTEITIAGEVPDVATQVRTFVGSSNLSAMANAYPADFVFGNSSLASNASLNSSVSLWDVANQGWIVGGKTGKGWDANVKTAVVAATSGFFLKEAGTKTSWTNAKPYTWP